MPPEIVREVLRPSLDFPRADNVEGIAVHHENSARAVATSVAKRTDVDRIRAAVNGMGARVARALYQLFRLDDAHDPRLRWIGFCVNDVYARRPKARHDQKSAFDVGMRRERAQCGAACVPTKMVEFVAGVGKLDAPDLGCIGRR